MNSLESLIHTYKLELNTAINEYILTNIIKDAYKPTPFGPKILPIKD